jgi:hypothetical protein
MKKSHKLSLVVLGVLAACAVIASMQGRQLLEAQLRRAAVAYGFEQLSFSVESVGARGITFAGISLPGAVPLRVDKVTIDYSLMKLLQGDVHQITIPEVDIEKDGVKLTAQKLLVEFFPREGMKRHGLWKLESLTIAHESLPLAPLVGAGEWGVEDSRIRVSGEFKSQDESQQAIFGLDYKSDDLEHSHLALMRVKLPWNGGQVLVQDARIDLQPGKAMRIPVRISNVPLSEVLKVATANRATATGMVSGTVPVIIGADGQVSIGTGKLQTAGVGVITLAPDAIPGDNAQVALVRDIMQNFHYTQFSLALESGKNEQLSILLSLSGNNPDVHNGREVKLNVNLSGDLLDLLRQSIMPLADPKQLLKDNHAKP